MKDDFNKLEGAIQDAYNSFKDMAEICSGPKMEAFKKKIYKNFTTVSHYLKKVEAYVPSVSPIDLKNEWGGEEFFSAWQFYKDYLKEQHHSTLASRTELKRIKYIRDACNDDVQIAIKYLDWLMATSSISVREIDISIFDKKNTENNGLQKQGNSSTITLPFAVRGN